MLFALGPWLRQDPTTGGPYMDLATSQTAAGDKSLSGLTRLTRPNVAGTSEEHLRWTTDDDASSFGSLRNYSGANGVHVPCEWGQGATSTEFAHAWVAQAGAGADTGAVPVGLFQAVNSAVGAIATRPVFGWYNGANLRMAMAASGAMSYTIGAQAGVAETLATWATSDTPTSAGIFAENGTAIDASFGGRIRAQANGTSGAFGLEVVGEAAAAVDAGTTPCLALRGRLASGSASAARPSIGLYSGTNLIWTLSVNLNLDCQRVGSGIGLKSGTNARKGSFTLSAGAATVANTSIRTGDVILAMLRVKSGTVEPLAFTLTASTQFVATGNAADNSTYDYIIIGESL